MSTSTETPPAAATGFKPKKSVALSGVPAGNTALCTVGRSGNDLHYRGYDILELAESCEFEEVAHLLVHGKLPNAAELKGYKAKLKRLRGLPEAVQLALQALPASSHPMDVLRTGTSVLGCVLPEKDDHNAAGARDIADRLLASLGSMLCYWYHYSHSGRVIEVETDDDFLALYAGLDVRFGFVGCLVALLHFECDFVGAAVLRTAQRADRSGDARVEVGTRARDDAAGEG